MSKPKKLPQNFFERPADVVAKDLLGCEFHFHRSKSLYRARIVETEAYMGKEDLACHASKGETPRTKVMFGPPGYAYVYLIYGMYQMFNVVCSKEGDPQAVLIRAAEAIQPKRLNLSGPGRFTKNFGIIKKHNAIPLFKEIAFFTKRAGSVQIESSPRIGVDYAASWKDAKLRFFDGGSPAISKAPSKRSK